LKWVREIKRLERKEDQKLRIHVLTAIESNQSSPALEDLEYATHDHHALWSWLQQAKFGAEGDFLFL
jgi:hypothetical protein